jgi:hypothetical protein
MIRMTRIAVAAVLAAAVAALPMVLDRCAASCDAHQNAVTTAPACHHATPTGTRITRSPASCGHDHNATALTAAEMVARTARAFALVAMLPGSLSAVASAGANLLADPHSPPDPSPVLAARSLPLRV